MMIHALLLAAATAAPPAMPARDDAARMAITVYIERCATEWAMTAVAPNREAMARCLADDYQGVSARGTVVDKATYTAEGEPPGKAAGLYYAKPRFVSESMAIVRGEEWWEPKDGSGRQHLIWTDIWLLRAGGWQVVASQDSIVPFDQPLQNRP
jgi:hypothetical protein